MKVIAIGDTHGRILWREIIEKEQPDKVVFIGDYFDTHEGISPEQQKRNFENIVHYKEKNKEGVVLLIGNHDTHYLKSIGEHYSGYNRYHAMDIEKMLNAALGQGLMQMCYVQKEYIFVHAGFTKTWCRNNLGSNTISNGDAFMQTVNDLFSHQPWRFKFTPGNTCDVYGNEVEQSPVWVRPESLYKDALNGFTQVVGHTVQKHISFQLGVWLIDTLGTSGEYLVIENETAKAKAIKAKKNSGGK